MPRQKVSRFEQLAAELAQRPGVRSPRALAVAIGRRKYGARAMARMAAAGRTPNSGGYCVYQQRPDGRWETTGEVYRTRAAAQRRARDLERAWGRPTKVVASNPWLEPLVEGLAVGVGFSLATGMAAPLVVHHIQHILGREKREDA